jgi:SAM-dependent methyltransferase
VSPFADHFSRRADAYAAHRPDYPAELFAFLASVCPRHDLAWDCGTGNGQAAVGLAEHFLAVHATDPSEPQLAHARPHPRITYRRTDETASGLPSAGADLVAAAQAFHWLNGAAFFAEARRVSRPDGVVAVWCYGLPILGAGADAVLRRFHDVAVGPDWPPGRELVTTLYRTIAFPFDEITVPPFAIERLLDLAAFGRYVSTWSAVHRHQIRTGHDPVPDLLAELRPAWGDEVIPRRIVWPIGLRAGRT